jgi:hypothetical protein
MTTNYNKQPYIIPNGHKIFQIYKHLPFKGPPKFTQIWYFWFENKPSGRNLKKYFWAKTVIFLFSTQAMSIMSIIGTLQHCSAFPKTLTLAGFEPGFSVPEADAMSTAPRRHQGG